MHELALMQNLVHKIESVLSCHKGSRPVSISIAVHPLFFPSEAHLRRHFSEVVRGSALAGVSLEITWLNENNLSQGGAILLDNVEVIPE